MTEVKAVILVRTTLSLSALVDLCVYSDSVDSSLVFWAPHDDHAFLTVFAVLVVGMTVFAMESEEGVLDVSAPMKQTLHTSTSGW